MRQFLAIFAAFALMPVMNKKKIPFGPTLLLIGSVLVLFAGLAPITIVTSLTRVFTDMSTVRTIIVVIFVGVLGTLLKKYDFLGKIVGALQELIPSKKVLIMALPAVLGLLAVPGGAFLSAPFVDELGKDLDIMPSRRATINLYFRHFSTFILPVSSTMVFLPTVMPDISIYKLIGLNFCFVIFEAVICYTIYLAKAPKVTTETKGEKATALRDVLIYLSPVYMPVVFNTVLGIPLYIAVMLCVVWLLFISEQPFKGLIFCGGLFALAAVTSAVMSGNVLYAPAMIVLAVTGFSVGLLRHSGKYEFVKTAWEGINFSTLFMLVGVYFLQNVIRNLDEVMMIFQNLVTTSSGLTVLIVIAAASMLLGLTTGLSLVPLGVILPMISAQPFSPQLMLVYTFFVYMWAFLGYYYSPLHLCTLLTIKYMGCTTGEVYKEQLRAAPFLMLSSFVLFYFYKFLLVR